jgi:aminotransferase
VALGLGAEYYDELGRAYARRRDFMVDALSSSGFLPFMPAGAYYVMTDIAGFGAESDVAFCGRLVREFGVAAVPGSSFYRTEGGGRRQVRFCFCKRDETLREAATRLENFHSTGRRGR